jgi:hypothetical protein
MIMMVVVATMSTLGCIQFTEQGKVSISDETPELFADDTILSITNFVGEVVLVRLDQKFSWIIIGCV